MAKQIKRGLGKGLGALIATEENMVGASVDGGVLEIDINSIEPNKNQPRRRFNDESLSDLATSINQFGIIQPLILNKEDGYYTIVAGERRWRAARIAKLKTVPAIIKNYDEMDTLQIALIENIQREDLNPIEEALCYQKLGDIFFFRQEDIATKVGKSRNTISAFLSLLKLDPRVQNFIIEGKISSGHGKKLLELEGGNLQFEAAEKIIEDELSIAQAGKLMEVYKKQNIEKSKEKIQPTKHNYKHIETDLMNVLGTKVNIKDGKNKGKIEIEYYSPEELDRITIIFKNLQSN